MASMAFSPTYFLCPLADPVPAAPEGPLALGSVLKSPNVPLSPLNRDAALTPPKVVSTVETDWQKSVSDSTSMSFGIFASFMELVLGAGADVSVDHSRANHSNFAFDKLTTLSFEPTLEYIKEALQAAGVRQYRDSRGLARCKSLYIVTGLKLASGAAIRYVSQHGPGIAAQVGVDGSAAGVPISVGPTGHWARERTQETSFYRGDEFIFAYRLHKISFFLQPDPATNLYIKGAFLDAEQSGISETQDIVQFMLEDIDGASLPGSALVSASINGPLVYVVRPAV
ncbi:hypothetical protein McanMca71_007798 [Microsporum canis]|uniref:Uncharacterized protein n=1 Tax=Arthroderma otae (strain ATCC MYA-4605 / CBS 113480) TaxID=554155 RepID=C5FNZ6_ARTOC|nr:conserved hypothetical protein [Microsporum canis CBS 113480]EEQ31849.1 conserved hypothetical protein [Microsporum canis CBS 113480]